MTISANVAPLTAHVTLVTHPLFPSLVLSLAPSTGQFIVPTAGPSLVYPVGPSALQHGVALQPISPPVSQSIVQSVSQSVA